jgi:diguanylate cyclase (GGDEF)-like protein
MNFEKYPPDSETRVWRVVTQIHLSAAAAAGLVTSGFGPFELQVSTDATALRQQLAEAVCDALLLRDGTEAELAAADAGRDTAVLIVADRLEPGSVTRWLQRGAQDVLLAEELETSALPQRLRAAIERKRLERDARSAYATDLETGLPHQQQLIEHMSQLLALREREPAPMAVLALRIEGLASVEARLGRDAAQVLRRKVAVRLRAGVRASDVVAALGDDSFAVLLGSLLTPAHAAAVGEKLLRSMLAPLRVAGQDFALATALGIGQYPEDGTQPDALLRRAVGLAATAQAQGRVGFANFQASGPASPNAANDE